MLTRRIDEYLVLTGWKLPCHRVLFSLTIHPLSSLITNLMSVKNKSNQTTLFCSHSASEHMRYQPVNILELFATRITSPACSWSQCEPLRNKMYALYEARFNKLYSIIMLCFVNLLNKYPTDRLVGFLYSSNVDGVFKIISERESRPTCCF